MIFEPFWTIQDTWVIGTLKMGFLVSPSFGFKEKKGLPFPFHWKGKESLSLRAALSPESHQLPPLPVLFYRSKGWDFHPWSQAPAGSPICTRWTCLHTGSGALPTKCAGQMARPKEVCAESHWHFKWAGQWFVFLSGQNVPSWGAVDNCDHMKLSDKLIWTTWGRSEWIIVLPSTFWKKAALLLLSRYSNGNQVWPGEVLGELLQGPAQNEL